MKLNCGFLKRSERKGLGNNKRSLSFWEAWSWAYISAGMQTGFEIWGFSGEIDEFDCSGNGHCYNIDIHVRW
jgi:hypothetical protein